MKCFYPLFAFVNVKDRLEAKLRPGNVHSTDGIQAFSDPMVKRYRSQFVLFRLCADAAFGLAGYVTGRSSGH